jgi:hypothetical protein
MVLVLCVMLQSRSIMVYCKGKLAIWINMAIVWTSLLFEWVLQQTTSTHCWRLAIESVIEICTNKSSQNCKKNSFFSYWAPYSEISLLCLDWILQDESVRLWNMKIGVCIFIFARLVAIAMKYLTWLVLFFVLMTVASLICQGHWFFAGVISSLIYKSNSGGGVCLSRSWNLDPKNPKRKKSAWRYIY